MDTCAPPSNLPPKVLEREVLERAVHDLKNPLAVVRASLEWLELELTDREEALDAVRDARVASERLMTIVDDLDSLARIGAEDAPTDDSVALVPLVPLVTAVVASANGRLARRGITVVAITPSEGALDTNGDVRLLRRSLTALIDATARGAPSDSLVEVTVRELAPLSGPAEVEISVALRGAMDVGPPMHTLEALESSGLGVYVALRVVEVHGGVLQLIQTTSLPRIVVRLPR